MEIKSRIELPLLMKHFGLPMIAVEIGVEAGYNSTDLLKNGIEKIYCVDSWEANEHESKEVHENHFQNAIKNLSQFDRDRYVILRAPSNEAHVHIEDNSLGLVYIDGLHTYKMVKSDIQNYVPKLVAGGVLAFHDYPNIKGVRVAVKQFSRENYFEIHDIPESNRGDSGCWMTIVK